MNHFYTWETYTNHECNFIQLTKDFGYSQLGIAKWAMMLSLRTEINRHDVFRPTNEIKVAYGIL